MAEYRAFALEGEGPDFVISDGTRDTHGTRINPNGWVLEDFNRHPVALFGHGHDPRIGSAPIGRWENVRSEAGRLIGRLALAAAGTSTIIDELRSLVEQGLLRAASVGFTVLRHGTPGKSEWDYEQQRLVEISLVSIPSNSNALAIARSLKVSDETMSVAFGEQAEKKQPDKSNGKHAATSPHVRNGKVEQSVSKQVEGATAALNAARDALNEHLKGPNPDGEQADLYTSELEQCERRLSMLERAEKALAVRIVEQVAPVVKTDPPKRMPIGLAFKETAPEEYYLRAAVVHLLAKAKGEHFEKVLEQHYGTYRDYEATQLVTRAAVAAATTTTAGWAAELVETATADFMANLDPNAVFPKLSAAGTQLSFGPSRGAIKIPSRATTPTIGGSFVLEGSPIPVRRIGLTSITLNPHKVGVISAFTREIVRYSNPQIEGIVREAIRDDTAIILDGLLLDTTAGSTTRPAGLLNGVTPVTASAAATQYGRILADIGGLTSPFYAVNAGRKLVMLINPAQGLQLSMAIGPDGTFGWTTQFTGRFQVIESTTVPANKVVMIDAADFVSVLGTPEFEVSETATLHMEDTTPLAIGTTGTPATVAAPTSSMFQEAKIALRMLLDTTWAMRRTGMVQTIATVNWAPS